MKQKNALAGILAILLIALVVSSILLFVLIYNPDNESKVKTFDSYQELVDYVNSSSVGYGGEERAFAESVSGDVSATIAGESSGVSKDTGTDDYSTTNIQVEGVDEPDIVKNDGKYIYVVSGKKVVIVNAFPDIISLRYFAPKIGISEDLATGSAQCSLAQYWFDRLDSDSLEVFQLSSSGGYFGVRSISGDSIVLLANAKLRKIAI